MSQITRCPACATQFKVVADQLRISEGWVRCGQCKEVFDAAAHLVAAPPPPMLPDVSLTDTRPPPAVVSRPAEERGAWGVFDPPAPAPVPAPVAAVPSPVAPAAPTREAGARGGEAFEIPAPTVPAFLSAMRSPSMAPSGDELSLEPLQTFGWRAPPLAPLAPLTPLAPVVHVAPLTPSPPVPAAPPVAATVLPADAAGAAFVPPPPREESRVLPGLAASLLADLAPVASPAPPKAAVDPAGEGMVRPAGYELPTADFSDSLPTVDRDGYGDDGPDTEIMSLREGAGDEDAYPPLDLPATAPAARRSAPVPDEDDDDHDDGVPLFGHIAAAPEPGPPRTPVDPNASVSGFSDSVTPFPADADFELMPDPVFPASAPAFSRSDATGSARASATAAARESDEDDLPAGQPEVEEVSFVRAARRKAFWRRPLVRAFLGLAFVLLLGALALQVVVQERSRIAAIDTRTRPWLQQLCVHLGCTLAPRRQIADLVIDSSSFANRGRGDPYLLSVTVKNRAEIPLAMPAVELTLTDAQDQPVLRRVLLPADLGAPAELPARGDWSTSVPVVVTSGASRVSGYRVDTFYP